MDRPNIGYDALRATGNYWLMRTVGNYNIIYADVGQYRRYYAQSTVDRMIVYGDWLSYDEVMEWVRQRQPVQVVQGTVTGGIMSPTEWFTVVMSVAQGQGSISRTPDTGTVQSGTSVTFMAIAAEGYRFDHWTYDAGFMHNPDIRTATFTRQVTADAVAQAFFISSGGNGQGGNGNGGNGDGENGEPMPPSKSVMARSIGPLSVPSAFLHQLWRLREWFIRPDVHRKLHPLV